MRIEHANQHYRWNNKCWLDHYGLQVPDRLGAQLNRKYLENWWITCGEGETRAAIAQLSDLRRNAVDRECGASLRLVELMARQYLRRHPGDPYVLAVQCAALRAQKQPSLAIAAGMPHLVPGQSALRTTLAAALCDMERWPEAQQLLQESSNAYALRVLRRIRRNHDGPARDDARAARARTAA